VSCLLGYLMRMTHNDENLSRLTSVNETFFRWFIPVVLFDHRY